MAGILWVSSQILEPQRLSIEDFNDWYENDHALDVLRLPGVPGGTRYTAISTSTSSSTSTPDPHLFTYAFPSLSYAQSPEFSAIMNAALSPEIVERIYANTKFDIRFYAEFAPTALSPSASSSSSADSGSTAGSMCSTASARTYRLASILLTPHPGSSPTTAAELYFAGPFAIALKSLPGFIRLRRYTFVSGVVRERNVVSVTGRKEGGWLGLVEFEDMGAGEMEEVEKGIEEVVRRGGKEGVMGSVGWYGVRRVWGEGC